MLSVASLFAQVLSLISRRDYPKATAKLEQTPMGVAVTIPAGASWDALDTVIVLAIAR